MLPRSRALGSTTSEPFWRSTPCAITDKRISAANVQGIRGIKADDSLAGFSC
jgi:hypothetical protein